MHRHPLRKETNCLNCGETVQDRFCGHCGQENLETRQPFHSLFFHFFEDLTHYEGKFWSTMRYLLFKPAYLTKEFLAGRRGKFVPPVRLYIFISFVTFFLPSFLPEEDIEISSASNKAVIDTVKQMETDFISFNSGDEGLEVHIPRRYSTQAGLDSMIATLPEADRPSGFKYWMLQKMVPLTRYTSREIGENFKDQFKASFPKALFLFLPMFALVMWIFHSRKFWIYYDHAVFTLHYFSFILLLITLFNLITTIFYFTPIWTDPVDEGLSYLTLLYIPVYFFIGHRNLYREAFWKTLFKCIAIYIINLIMFVILIIGLTLFALFNM